MYKGQKELRDTDGKSQNKLFIKALVVALQSVKDTKRLVVVHSVRAKGKGNEYVEKHKESVHWFGPFDVQTGAEKFPFLGTV